jgi:hypothetical protein
MGCVGCTSVVKTLQGLLTVLQETRSRLEIF